MKTLVVSQLAFQMAEDAYEWYDELQSGLGDAFSEDLNSTFNRIKNQPELYQKFQKNCEDVFLNASHTWLFLNIMKMKQQSIRFSHQQKPEEKFKR